MQIYEITCKPLKEGVLGGIAKGLKNMAFDYGARVGGVNLRPYFASADETSTVSITDAKGVKHTYTKSGEKWYDETGKEADPAIKPVLDSEANKQASTRSQTAQPVATTTTSAPAQQTVAQQPAPAAAQPLTVGPGVMPQMTVTPSNVSYTNLPNNAKKHTGGKVAGSLSQTPGAIRKRAARLANKTTATEPSAISSMAKQLATKPVKTSTGGTMIQTPTGLVHTAKQVSPAQTKPVAKKKTATKKTTQEPKWTGRPPKNKQLADYYRALGLLDK